MNVDALIHHLRSIYIWIPYSSPVAKNKVAELIVHFGGKVPEPTEMAVAIQQQSS